MKFRSLLSVWGLGALLAVGAPAVGHAQDHLLCYTMTDPLKIQAAVDMFAAQTDFTQGRCTLTKAIEFCVPASKQNVTGAPTTATTVAGQPLQNDYICYHANCPKQPLPPDKNVLDQFGPRLETKYKPTKICVPAVKATVGCGPIGAACGGACSTGEQCKKIRTGTTSTCMCTAQMCGGKPDAGGSCGGSCTLPGQVCHPAINPATHAADCECQPPGSPCSVDGAGVCGGDCSGAGEQCVMINGECGCQQGDTTCGLTGTTCGGICPAGSQCMMTGNAAAPCGCQPLGCVTDPFGNCSGACPNNPGQVCTTQGGSCGCAPMPCGRVPGQAQCSGDCPVGSSLTCLPNVDNVCGCQQPCGGTAPNCSGACTNPADTCNPTTCTCVSPPQSCGFHGGICGGTCSAGKTCGLITAKNNPTIIGCGCK